MVRRTVGKPLPDDAGRYTAGRPWASNGATWLPSSSRMIGAALATPGRSSGNRGARHSEESVNRKA